MSIIATVRWVASLCVAALLTKVAGGVCLQYQAADGKVTYSAQPQQTANGLGYAAGTRASRSCPCGMAVAGDRQYAFGRSANCQADGRWSADVFTAYCQRINDYKPNDVTAPATIGTYRTRDGMSLCIRDLCEVACCVQSPAPLMTELLAATCYQNKQCQCDYRVRELWAECFLEFISNNCQNTCNNYLSAKPIGIPSTYEWSNNYCCCQYKTKACPKLPTNDGGKSTYSRQAILAIGGTAQMQIGYMPTTTVQKQCPPNTGVGGDLSQSQLTGTCQPDGTWSNFKGRYTCSSTPTGGGGTAPTCPANAADVFGAACTTNDQCEVGRLCCPTGGGASRCTCAGGNEVYSACYAGLCNGFEPTCATVGCAPSLGCRAGCFCRAGYVRVDGTTRSTCVPSNTCSGTSTGTGVVSNAPTPAVTRAFCDMRPAATAAANSAIGGQLQVTAATSISPVRITGQIKGLPDGEHGIAIMEYGDAGMNCRLIGGHFNPGGTTHGGAGSLLPTTVAHAGDLGNILSLGGLATVELSSATVQLAASSGRQSILGRSIAVHAGRDDLGAGSSAGSQTTGNAGQVIACGVIAAAPPIV